MSLVLVFSPILAIGVPQLEGGSATNIRTGAVFGGILLFFVPYMIWVTRGADALLPVIIFAINLMGWAGFLANVPASMRKAEKRRR